MGERLDKVADKVAAKIEAMKTMWKAGVDRAATLDSYKAGVEAKLREAGLSPGPEATKLLSERQAAWEEGVKDKEDVYGANTVKGFREKWLPKYAAAFGYK